MFIDLSCHYPCALCARPARQALCALCQTELRRQHGGDGPHCRCALPAPGSTPGALCGRCLHRPPPFTATTAAWPYRFPVDKLINGYKHHGRLDLERALQTLIADQPLPWPQADALCPLPAHWWRRALRGFDQAERLTRFLAARWQRPALPLLQRTRATAHQQGGNRRHRLRNLQGAFRASPRSDGLRVLLIDDVMTTGASARTAALALLQAGAVEVRVWVLARTPEAASLAPDDRRPS